MEFASNRHRIARCLGLVVIAVGLVLVSARVHAALGDCGQPVTSGSNPTATDCLYILNAAVGTQTCTPECICDVNAAGSVSATDALICLRKAVGDSVTLNCGAGCVGTTTSTTTTTLPQVSSTELLVFTKSQGSYVLADLAGTWDFSALATFVSGTYWSRGSLAIQSNGDFSGSLSDIDNHTDNVSGTLALAPQSGSVTCTTSQCPIQFAGALDTGKTVMAITYTWEDGATELLLGTKRGTSYVQADLAGDWQLNDMLSSPANPEWSRGALTIENNGAASGSISMSDGSSAAMAATLKLSSKGALTCTSGCSSDFRGALDSGKRIALVTYTGDLGAANLMILSRQAVSYAQSDLAGPWHVHSLVSGADAPTWNRGGIIIHSNGAFSGATTSNTGAVENISGTFVLSSTGIVTLTSGDPSFRCVLDALKTVFVCTST